MLTTKRSSSYQLASDIMSLSNKSTHQDEDFARDSFIPSVYNKTYYSTVMQDEAALIAWQSNELDGILKKHLANLKLKHFPIMLDAGSGPSAHHIIALSRYVKKIRVADFMPENLAEIEKWVIKDPQAHNWNLFTKTILEHEGNKFTKLAVIKRENQTRKKIDSLTHLNLKKLDHTYKDSALLVSSFFVADSATKSKKIFKKMSKNAFDIVQPGGLLVASYLGGCKRYRVGRKWINSADITENDIYEAFNELDARKLTVWRFETPDMQKDGFNHIFTVVVER